ncbi:glycine--tRNA ligase subunit beta [Ornithinibacillus sp. L9]|uniref:Glycine--tRNA ligase beta subunit n=1 Tax=Ornithinibacillus caprae TaxID=2678566 RepID=A0A6N8FH79_9BACI|nr:glycine--tRNA ligase subunit beta [Ornithinibacillus caprae]MUK87099.1 glycine--tRNA ligase subunit beta [Ornithinibacillus caprae]
MTKHVLFEIGLEELPARFIDDAEKQVIAKTTKWLQDLRISFDSVTGYSTPRRLAVLIQNMAEEQTTVEEEAKGPSVKIAKDEDGNWTKAAIGFTKGQGKTTDDIYEKEIKGTSYIFVKKHIEGKSSKELLPSFKEIIESIQFGKNMRWGKQTLRYARPIRWLVALYGEEVIPFEVAGVKTNNITFGHRFLGKEIVLENPMSYKDELTKNFVMVEASKREELIKQGIQEIERKEGFEIPVDEGLLNEVRNLVEFPTVFVGSYEKEFLNLPSEVLITSMKEHQRYFPVKSANGELLPYFVGVRNGNSEAIDTVTKGNEKVLRARLSDAQFFYEEDLKQPIEYYQRKLENVVFQEKLGTISEKVDRVVHITKAIANLIKVDQTTKEHSIRASEISKFDLMTNMVNEFTELQGVIGEKYAMKFGEDSRVAQAVREQYLPNAANGKLPESVEGAMVSIADKLDTIVGSIYVGLKPTGSQDPYGLRRQAIGILRILQNVKWNISVKSLLEIPINLYESLDIEQIGEQQIEIEVMDFMKQRAVFLLKELDIETDVIEAVLQRNVGVLTYSVEKAKILSEKRNDPAFKVVQEALVRILNLSDKAEGTEINKTIFETPSEANLYEAYHEVKDKFYEEERNGNAESALNILSKLAQPIHEFFDNNMVMAKDDQLRLNRLALVKSIANLISEYANLTAIEWKQQF